MANGIPEWLTPALVLGIIGTTTGVLALIFHFLKYRRERPDLRVDVLDCRHKVATHGKSTNLYIKYTLHNKGDRGTRLNKIEASVTDFKGEKHYASENLLIPLIASDSLTLHHYFYFRPHFQYREKMQCAFKLHHTYKIFQFQCESKESEIAVKDLDVGTAVVPW